MENKNEHLILGVFIGMQVSNWNQQRVLDQQAAIFTAHLKADLREQAWRYQLLIVYSKEVLANGNRAVGALDGTGALPDEDLLVSAYRASQYKQGLRRRSTYDELISTGTISLIREQRLRDTAMRLYNIPAFDNLVQEGMLDYRCSTELPRQVIAESAKVLRSNPGLVPLLRLRIADIETRLVDLTGNHRDILDNLRAIASE